VFGVDLSLDPFFSSAPSSVSGTMRRGQPLTHAG
jgi:hypothetical protein